MANPYGRPKGSQNKNRLDVQARLDALGCDPVTGLATIAMDPANTPRLQAYRYSEFLSYFCFFFCDSFGYVYDIPT